MVGVPGKYKGCNTCRIRRVKCDNERPHCRKCIDGGRECGGYERETVFIIGTLEDGGRCSSHPPRIVKNSKRSKVSPKPGEDESLDLLPLEPLQPAWDDLISVSNLGTRYQIQITALHTSLQIIVRGNDEKNSSKVSLLKFQPYEPSTIRPFMDDRDFQLKAQCLIHLSPVNTSEEGTPEEITDSICLFLYEHNWSLIFSDQPHWNDPAARASTVRRLGPENFQTFPNHHFFVRVYRHNAICTALLNRKATFLSGPEWTTTPWELHPKSFFDKLFDIIVHLPLLLARADPILLNDPTLPRRLMAQDLLGNCLSRVQSFDEWHKEINPEANDQSQPYWIEEPDPSDSQIPFADTFAFKDGVTAVTFIYYWTSLIVFYPCIEKLYDAIFQPVLDAFPQIYPNLSPNLQRMNPHRFGGKEVRDLAANVCRSLDFALSSTVQPDMLVVPLFVVHEFYRDISASAGDGQLEMMWCEAFRARLTGKGQDIADVVQSRKWQDLAKY